MSRFLLLPLLVSLFTPGAIAQSRVDQYAYKSQLTGSQQALQSVAVPLQVITSLTRADLGDLAVLDASGQPVAGWIRESPPQTSREQVDLDFYEFSAYIHSRSKTVTTRENPSLISTEVLPVQTTRQDYIIELSETQQKMGIDSLQLTWTHQPADQILQVTVEVADDIDNWTTVHVRKNLSNKAFENSAWSQIDGIPKGKRYIRLTPADSVRSFALQQVSGFYQSRSHREYLWHALSTLESEPEQSAFYKLPLPSAVYPQRLRLIPATNQQLIKGDLYASQQDFENKRRVFTGIQQHNIPASDQVKASKPIDLARHRYTSWWFKADQPLQQAPSAEWGYPRYEYLFLSNNNGPFTLVWGNYEAQAPANDLVGLLSQREEPVQSAAEQVELGPIQQAGGIVRLQAEAPTPWLKWSLWLFLVVAVMITARMAQSLYRDMKTP